MFQSSSQQISFLCSYWCFSVPQFQSWNRLFSSFNHQHLYRTNGVRCRVFKCTKHPNVSPCSSLMYLHRTMVKTNAPKPAKQTHARSPTWDLIDMSFPRRRPQRGKSDTIQLWIPHMYNRCGHFSPLFFSILAKLGGRKRARHGCLRWELLSLRRGKKNKKMKALDSVGDVSAYWWQTPLRPPVFNCRWLWTLPIVKGTPPHAPPL